MPSTGDSGSFPPVVVVLPNSPRTPPPGASPPPGMTRPGRLRRLLVSGRGAEAPAAGTSSSPNALGGSWGPAAFALPQPSSRELNGAEVESGVALYPYSMSPRVRPRLTTYLASLESHPSKLSLSFPGPWAPTPPTQPCHATLV